MLFKNNPTKEKIVEQLSKNWPLTLTELQKTQPFAISYQYLRQCMQELVEQGIVVKRGFAYELSEQWLEKTYAFSKTALDNYRFGIKNNIFTRNTTQIHVHSLEELGNVMLDALENRFLEKKDKQGFFCHVSHLWIPFINKEKQEQLKKIGEYTHIVYTKKSILDIILDKACYKKYATSIAYSPQEMDYNFFVYNSCVFQIYFPEELNKLMDALYTGNIDVFQKIADLFAMTYKRFPITIIIIRNSIVAEKHRIIVQDILNK